MSQKTKTQEQESLSSYLFNFETFIEELRQNEEKRTIIQEYEDKVLGGKPITGKIEDQKWYKDYLSKIKPIPNYKVPEELESDFDWKLLFQLIAGSFSSEYKLETLEDESSLPELTITVKNNDQKIEKKISELWSFQVLRLFEIYIEELIGLEPIKHDKDSATFLTSERRNRIKTLKSITRSKLANQEKKKEEGKSYLVYHYCNLESAYQIIRNRLMYASDASYTNDQEELAFSRRIFMHALNGMIEDSEGEVAQGLQELRGQIESNIDNSSLYLTCFSRKRDDLNQWRAYGNNGFGLCIGVNWELALGARNSDGFWNSDVIYVNEHNPTSLQYNKLLKDSMMTKLEELSLKYIQGKKTRIEVSEAIQDLIEIPTEITQSIRFYKNECFKEEQEYRVLSLNEKGKYPVKTRLGKSNIIPYIELPLVNDEGEPCIQEIIIGPAVKNAKLLEKSLKLFLKEQNIEFVSVIRSKLPYAP
ncbi:DUF2971 domain-containing protein [Porphyromonas gulae]|uniref:DUF2971 domain-containing protein n=1 Tax=Porphyromonas gulae TaxID=111105 RepID=UPI0003A6E268|nr:DUF2971 domain-containing protein [Porphyromonas gulae]